MSLSADERSEEEVTITALEPGKEQVVQEQYLLN